MFIKEQSSEFPVKKMCQVLDVARSRYYEWRKTGKSPRGIRNEELLTEIKKAHIKSRKIYGSPRIHSELKESGLICSKNRVARIMNVNGVRSKIKRKYKSTTNSNHDQPVANNHLNQHFDVDAPNKAWVADITYIWTSEGWLYLAVVLDLFSRKIVGWAMRERIDKELVVSSIRAAIAQRKPSNELLLHSDRGVQYSCQDVRALLKEYGITQSMSGKGNCYDNAVAESFFHSLKTEHVSFEKYEMRKDARTSIFDYIEMFYNRERRHSSLGNVSPVRFEEMSTELVA